jgi:hypothetical protein
MNGQFIRSLKGFYVEWLASFGQFACVNLRELDVIGYVQPPEKQPKSAYRGTTSTLSKILGLFLQGQSAMFRKLTVGGGILCSETEVDLVSLMRSIPTSVEELGFYRWWGHQDAQLLDQMEKGEWEPDNLAVTNGAAITNFLYQYQQMRRAITRVMEPTPAFTPTSISTASPSSQALTSGSMRLDCLPNLKRLVFDHSCIDKPAIAQWIPWLPALETLALFNSNIVQPLHFSQALLAHCPLLSSLCISRTGREHCHSFSSLTCSLLLCTSRRGWSTVALVFQDEAEHLHPPTQLPLKDHAGTLETLFLQGCYVDDHFVQEMLSSSPLLKHFVVIVASRGGDAIHPRFISEAEWVCRDLEVFRVGFDMRRLEEQWPYNVPDHELYIPDVGANFEVQRVLYRQLGRLTKLKELIVGFIEDDELSCAYYPQNSRRSFIDLETSGGRQPSHSTNLDNGLDLLKNLSQVRRVELPDLKARGFMKYEEDKVWVSKHWQLLEEGYRSDFWTAFKHPQKCLGFRSG